MVLPKILRKSTCELGTGILLLKLSPVAYSRCIYIIASDQHGDFALVKFRSRETGCVPSCYVVASSFTLPSWAFRTQKVLPSKLIVLLPPLVLVADGNSNVSKRLLWGIMITIRQATATCQMTKDVPETDLLQFSHSSRHYQLCWLNVHLKKEPQERDVS